MNLTHGEPKLQVISEEAGKAPNPEPTVTFGESERMKPPVVFDKADPKGQGKFLLDLIARQEGDGYVTPEQAVREAVGIAHEYDMTEVSVPKQPPHAA
jgi:hypothetical protein